MNQLTRVRETIYSNVLHKLTVVCQHRSEFIRRLHAKVNSIPIIAKAGTMTDEEIAAFKARVSEPGDYHNRRLTTAKVLSGVAYHKIHILDAPTYENEDEEVLSEQEETTVRRFAS